MAEILLTEGHNGATIPAKVGDMLTLQLPENPTTGFRWTAAANLGSLIIKEDDFQPGGESGIGGSGLRRWRFAARSPGKIELEFRLARPWEAGAPKAVFRVQVQVS